MRGDDTIHDAGSVSSAGARVSGCTKTTPAKSGTGVYTLTQDEQIDAAEGCCIVTLRGASGTYKIDWTSDSVITVSTFAVDGTTATDKAFDFVIVKNKVN